MTHTLIFCIIVASALCGVVAIGKEILIKLLWLIMPGKVKMFLKKPNQ